MVGIGICAVALAGAAMLTCCTDFPHTIVEDIVLGSSDVNALLDDHTDSHAAGGSDMELLTDGPATLEVFYNLIRSAGDHINIETLSFDADATVSQDLAVEFVAMLVEKVRQGVRVNLIVDPIGQTIYSEPNVVRALRQGGVNVRSFVAPNDELLLDTILYRTHKKILVADGRQALVGGRNIGPGYFDRDHWRDTTVLLTGPVVASVQYEFLRDWYALGGTIDNEDRYFPTLDAEGMLSIRSIDQRPAQGDFDLNTAVWIALRLARTRIDIQTPYLNPTRWLFDELADAAGRGVGVRMITNSRASVDLDAVFAVNAFWFDRLIEAGVRVFLWDQPGRMMHSKVMVVDDDFAMVGSYNFNFRSITWDAENAVIFTDPQPVDQVRAMLDDDFDSPDVFEIDRAWLDAQPDDDRDAWNTAHLFTWLF